MDYAEKDFGKMIKKNAQSQRHELLPRDINCMRIYDRNLEAYPVTVDLYDKYARVVDYGDLPMSEERVASCVEMINRMAYVDKDKIIYIYRNKREKGEQHEKNQESLKTTVTENGHKFNVELKMYTDTGLFLDHVETRALIEEKCAGCDVLNLFSYTGSFSVYAAAGNAKTVTSVDLSATYTKWAEENLELNGYTGQNYKCICMDAGKFITEAHEKNDKYDIIIFDPPAFSNSRKMEEDFDVAKDYAVWIKNLATLLRKDGVILFSTNLSSFKMDKRRLRGLDVKEITDWVMAPGFVKSRKGTVRSWIMANDDNSLTLDWSEEKKSPKADAPKKEYGKREYVRRNDRPRFDRDDRRRDNRRRDDRSRFDRDDRRRDDRRRDDRPRFDRDDRRRYDRRRDDRPRFDHDDRRRDERSEKSSGYQRSDRYKTEERSHYEHRRYETDRPERSARREKPYGYDSFRPARSRNDNSDFFWNNEDFNRKH